MSDIQNTTSTKAAAKKSDRISRSKRLAFDVEGKETNDLTMAVQAAYVVIDAANEKRELYRLDYAPDSPTAYGRAAQVFGFHTHAGNWANTGWNTASLDADEMPEHMAIYAAMIEEGGWTNRKGEAQAGSAIFIEALARLHDVDPERVKAAWEAYDDDQRDAIRKDIKVKAMVADIRAERANERAAQADPAKPSLVDSLTF